VKILIVEDVQFSSMMLEKFLFSLGHEVLNAGSGYEALDFLVKEDGIQLVITDLFLSDISGFEVFQECKSLDKFKEQGLDAIPPFVLLTSSTNVEDHQKADMLGFSATLIKPFDKSRLEELLQSFEVGGYSLKKDSDKSKILVVDPQAKLQAVLQDLFSGSGYTLLFIASGQECVNCLTEYKGIKAVITDLLLKDMDAIALINSVNELSQSGSDLTVPPFIVLTDSKDPDRLQLAYVSGFSDVISSPTLEKSYIKQKINKVFLNLQKIDDVEKNTILIVDDVGTNCIFTKKMIMRAESFQENDFKFITATSPKDALDLLKRDLSIFLVISDLYMPAMNGFDLYANYIDFVSKNPRLIEQKAKFMMISSSSNQDDYKKAKKIGFLDVFRKPLDSNFVMTIDTYLRESHTLPVYEEASPSANSG
jgi:CheY-like chemotaxis protein